MIAIIITIVIINTSYTSGRREPDLASDLATVKGVSNAQQPKT